MRYILFYLFNGRLNMVNVVAHKSYGQSAAGPAEER